MSLSPLRVERVEAERDAALSVLLHITDTDRIIDLELKAPKRLSNVIFSSLFFCSLRCDVFNRPLRYGLFGDVVKLAALNSSPNLRFVAYNSHGLLSLGRAHSCKVYCFTGTLGRLRD